MNIGTLCVRFIHTNRTGWIVAYLTTLD